MVVYEYVSGKNAEALLQAMYRSHMEDVLKSEDFAAVIKKTSLSGFTVDKVAVWIESGVKYSYSDAQIRPMFSIIKRVSPFYHMNFEVIISYWDSAAQQRVESRFAETGVEVEETGKDFYEEWIEDAFEEEIAPGDDI